MAIYHLRVKFVQRSQGRSAVAAAAYRSGERLRDERHEITHDYTRKQGIEHTEILLPDHVPERFLDRETLWNTVEMGLKRKDSQPAFEVEMALPRELSHEKRVALARRFANDHFVKQGLVVDMCLHLGQASDGGEHPHVHMLITTRRWNDDGSMGKAARDLQDSPALLRKVYALEQEGKLDEALLAAKGTNLAGWRKAWADYSNDFLSDGGHADRIDHRTLAAQKIDREPMPNIGFAIHREGERVKGWLAERVEKFRELSQFRKLRQQFERIRETRRDLTAEFVAMAREHAKDIADLVPGSREKGADHDR